MNSDQIELKTPAGYTLVAIIHYALMIAASEQKGIARLILLHQETISEEATILPDFVGRCKTIASNVTKALVVQGLFKIKYILQLQLLLYTTTITY